jgi:hypothetical protein
MTKQISELKDERKYFHVSLIGRVKFPFLQFPGESYELLNLCPPFERALAVTLEDSLERANIHAQESSKRVWAEFAALQAQRAAAANEAARAYWQYQQAQQQVEMYDVAIDEARAQITGQREGDTQFHKFLMPAKMAHRYLK